MNSIVFVFEIIEDKFSEPSIVYSIANTYSHQYTYCHLIPYHKFWREEIAKLDQSRDNNTSFWKNWKRFGENKMYNQLPEKVNGQEWENHFINLFSKQNGNINEILEKIEMLISHELNMTSTMAELQNIIKNMQNRKAFCPDGISNEFLKHTPGDLLDAILKLLNLNIKNGVASTNCCLDLISTIHKEGPKGNPSNYRGICIMNSLRKVLCSLMKDGLVAYCTKHKLINREQIGFQKNSRTSDHILSLKTLVNKCHRQKGRKTSCLLHRFQKGIRFSLA